MFYTHGILVHPRRAVLLLQPTDGTSQLVFLPHPTKPPMGRTIFLPYPIKQPIGRILFLPYPTKQPRGRILFLPYPINQPFGRILFLPYPIKHPLGGTVFLPYPIKQPTRRTIFLPYPVKHPLGLFYPLFSFLTIPRVLPKPNSSRELQASHQTEQAQPFLPPPSFTPERQKSYFGTHQPEGSSLK